MQKLFCKWAFATWESKKENAKAKRDRTLELVQQDVVKTKKQSFEKFSLAEKKYTNTCIKTTVQLKFTVSYVLCVNMAIDLCCSENTI